ncbi:MAG: ABC-type transport auxiliary lipoprotein family protein [Nitrospiraceae bacterium]
MIQVATALLMVSAAGCLAPRTESLPTHTFQLSLDPERTESRPPDLSAPVLLVSLLQAEPGFDTPRMVYVKRPYELEYYAVNQWADTPARMIASLMVQALGRTGTWRAVIPLPGSIRGDYRLDSQGLALQQEFLHQPSLVRVTVRAQLVDVKESRVVGTRAFEAVEKAPSEDAYGGVLAANRATATLLDRLAVWLQDCLRHQPECGR